MTKSFEKLNNPIDYTKFKYLIKNYRTDEIIQMGLECIDQNIPVTFISCPEIKQVKVIYNHSEKNIYNYNSVDNNNSVVKIFNDGSEKGKTFLTPSINNSNHILSQFNSKFGELIVIGNSIFSFDPINGKEQKRDSLSRWQMD